MARSQVVVRCCAIVAVACSLAASARAAAPETEPIRIEYLAAPGCPDAGAFREQVFARTSSARPASPDETARAFVVEVRKAGARFTGSLVIQEPDGATVARRVSATECSAVASVLALATALAIDPRAELVPREAPETTVSDAAKPRPAASASGATAPPENELSAERPRWRPRVTFGPRIALDVAPSAAFGAAAGFAVRRDGTAWLGDGGVELSYLRASPAPIAGARASFELLLARPALCSVARISETLRLVPCAVVELGGMRGVGSDIPIAWTAARFWAAFEADLGLELSLGDAWAVELAAGLGAPLTRYRFVFRNPNTSIHEVPAWVGSFALRLARSF